MRSPSWFPTLSLVVALAALVLSFVRPLLDRQQPHELVLTDPDGRPRIVLTARNNGGRIELRDTDGKPCAVLHEEGENIALEVAPTTDAAAIQLRVAKDRTAQIKLSNANSGSSLDLYAGGLGDSGMVISTSASMLAMVSSPIRTSVWMQSGEQRTELETTDISSTLKFSHKLPAIELRHSPSGNTLELTHPGTVDRAVQIATDKYGATMSLNRTPRTATAPIRFSVTKDEGASLQVDGKELGR